MTAAVWFGVAYVGEWMGEGPAIENRTVGIMVDAGGDG